MKIEKISVHHDEVVSGFDCGNEEINYYLKEKAYIDYDCVTHLILSDDSQICMGYFSLSCAAVYMNDGYKIHTKPAVEIKYFAIDKKYQGVKLNDNTYANIILNKVIGDIIFGFTEDVCGASRIILYSTPLAVNFYRKAHFVEFDDSFFIDQSSYLDECIPMIYYYD